MVKEEFITQSIETNLFFARIMREHTLFISAATPPKYSAILMNLEKLRKTFDNLLTDAVSMSAGTVRRAVREGGQLVTKNTLDAEKAAQFLTGVYVNTRLTEKQIEELEKSQTVLDANTVNAYYDNCLSLNKAAIAATKQLAELKSDLFKQISDGMFFASIFPSVLIHMVREAEKYIAELQKLSGDCDDRDCKRFWCAQANEHSVVSGSWLDPSEESLRNSEEAFMTSFEKILAAPTMDFAGADTALSEYATFNDELTQAILEHRILSQMLALFTDHLSREAARGRY